MTATASPASQARVLVVGAGPAGLFAACELARHGVAARLVERDAQPHRQARGTALQPAILEMLARAGILERFLATGVRVRGVRVLGPGQRELSVSTLDGLGCAHEFQCSLPQYWTEEILTAHLEALGGHVERGTAVLDIEDLADGLRVTLRDAAGATESVAFDYVVGAGGAHSVTRSSMHERLSGDTYGGRFIVADVKVGMKMPAEHAQLCVGPKGLVLLAPLPEDRFIMFVSADDLPAAATAGAGPGIGELSALVDARYGIGVGVHDLRWSSFFSMHKRMALRLSDGRRFLLGDAAHASSPLAGEGLNSALMDAADIAWKLALQLRGAAHPLLLESFEVERGLADRHVLDVSDVVHANVMGLVDAYARGETPSGPAPDPATELAFGRSRAMLDTSYAGSHLVGEHVASAAPPPGPAPGERFPDRVALTGSSHHLLLFGAGHDGSGASRFGHRWHGLVEVVDGVAAGFDAARSGVPEGGAVLVRPDGFIGFRAVPADAGGLAAVDAHLSTYLRPSAS